MLSAAIAALTVALLTIGAQAQSWPQRPVRIIVPYAAGGNSDGMARIAAQRLTDAFGQTFVVENRWAPTAPSPPTRWRAHPPTATRCCGA